MTTTDNPANTQAGRRRLTGPARIAAAKAIIAGNKANGEPTDPRVVEIARGKR